MNEEAHQEAYEKQQSLTAANSIDFSRYPDSSNSKRENSFTPGALSNPRFAISQPAIQPRPGNSYTQLQIPFGSDKDADLPTLQPVYNKRAFFPSPEKGGVVIFAYPNEGYGPVRWTGITGVCSPRSWRSPKDRSKSGVVKDNAQLFKEVRHKYNDFTAIFTFPSYLDIDWNFHPDSARLSENRSPTGATDTSRGGGAWRRRKAKGLLRILFDAAHTTQASSDVLRPNVRLNEDSSKLCLISSRRRSVRPIIRLCL